MKPKSWSASPSLWMARGGSSRATWSLTRAMRAGRSRSTPGTGLVAERRRATSPRPSIRATRRVSRGSGGGAGDDDADDDPAAGGAAAGGVLEAGSGGRALFAMHAASVASATTKRRVIACGPILVALRFPDARWHLRRVDGRTRRYRRRERELRPRSRAPPYRARCRRQSRGGWLDPSRRSSAGWL